jgi:hypothetical protein
VALTERSRSARYQGLTDLIEDEVAVGELLSYVPARDVEEPATKDFVAAQVSDVRADFSDLRADFSGLRAEFSDLRAEMAAMESRLTALAADQVRTSIQWTLGALISLVALIVAMGLLRGP